MRTPVEVIDAVLDGLPEHVPPIAHEIVRALEREGYDMSIRKFVALDILRKANERGEVGYVYGGDNEQLGALNEAERLGWIFWLRDATPGPGSRDEGQKRDIYGVTQAGSIVARGAGFVAQPSASLARRP